ncbi:hypothetical protein CXG50_10125 [Pseudomonas plecoglossicida]|nr:hypothetical protein CX682_25995 [Pseudomonas sp. FFUP_PS_41]PLU98049.1 hypothetical protein CXG52_12945 [Pseudomonas plecoglossicida]PLV09619.1 hypothetical protein CXG50_10125 [Pseudomonas plecoglossicida]
MQVRPLRGLARSHRDRTNSKPCAVPVGAGEPAKGPDLPTCNSLYGKSIPWKKQRFIPSCAKSGISRDDGAGNLAYPQCSQHLAKTKRK